MEIVKQLAIFLENKPGTLLKVARYLSEKGLNIEAMSITETVDHAVVRLVVDKPSEAIHLFGEMGLLVVDSELLKIPLNNQPGILASFCQQMSKIAVNIEYAYGSSSAESADVHLYVKVADPAKVMKKLKKAKF